MADKVARGKALVAKLRADPQVRDAEALAAHIGRFKKARKAGKSVGEAKKAALGKKLAGKPGGGSSKSGGNKSDPPDHEKGFNNLESNTGISEKQASYLRSLREGEMISKAGARWTYVGPQQWMKHAFALDMKPPKDKREASEMIDDLKRGGIVEWARKDPERAAKVEDAMIAKYGEDGGKFKKAHEEQWDKLTLEQKEKARGSAQAYRRYVLNPLLKP